MFYLLSFNNQSLRITKNYIHTMESATNKCPNIGCRKSFKYRMQLSRHKDQCQLPAPEKKGPKYIKLAGGSLQCGREGCSYTTPYRTSIDRHLKKKSCFKKQEIHECHFCDKTFQFPSRLNAHMNYHLKKHNNTSASFVSFEGKI